MLSTVTIFGLFCGSLRFLYMWPSSVSALLVFSLGVMILDLPLARLADVLNRKSGRTCARAFEIFSICVMVFILLAILVTFIPQLER